MDAKLTELITTQQNAMTEDAPRLASVCARIHVLSSIYVRQFFSPSFLASQQSKSHLAGLFVECTKVDVLANNLVSKARSSEIYKSVCNLQINIAGQ